MLMWSCMHFCPVIDFILSCQVHSVYTLANGPKPAPWQVIPNVQRNEKKMIKKVKHLNKKIYMMKKNGKAQAHNQRLPNMFPGRFVRGG